MGSDTLNHDSEIKYFSLGENQYQNLDNSIMNFKSTVKLEFFLYNTENNKKYSLKVLFDKNNSFQFRTETIKSKSNLNPLIFNTCYLGDYLLEKHQKIKIILITEEIENGFCETFIGNIMGSPNQTLVQYILGNIKIAIKGQEIKDIKSSIDFKFEGKLKNMVNGFVEKEDKISYLITSNNKKIYSSEKISPFGIFKPVQIPICLLDKGFKVSILDDDNKEILSNDDKLDNFIQNVNNIYIQFKTKENSHIISIINKSSLKLDNSSFIEYIKEGLKINLIIGIDYTKENLSPEKQMSLHYLGSGLNDYQQAINTSLNILSKYINLNQPISMFGFGAKLNSESNRVNNCFRIKLDNSKVPIQKELLSYKNSFNYLKLSEPAYFSHLILNVMNIIKIENSQTKYNILLIITCGKINDLNNTINALVQARNYPLSVIIIGVGNGPFKDMQALSGNNQPLYNSVNNKMRNNIVTFIPFNKYKNNNGINLLQEKIWEKIPQQISQYFQNKNILPNDLKFIDKYKIKSGSTIMNNPNQSRTPLDSNSHYNGNINLSNSNISCFSMDARIQYNTYILQHYNSN